MDFPAWHIWGKREQGWGWKKRESQLTIYTKLSIKALIIYLVYWWAIRRQLVCECLTTTVSYSITNGLLCVFPQIKLQGRRCHRVFLIRTRDPHKPQLSWDVIKKKNYFKQQMLEFEYFSSGRHPLMKCQPSGRAQDMSHLGQTLEKDPTSQFYGTDNRARKYIFQKCRATVKCLHAKLRFNSIVLQQLCLSPHCEKLKINKASCADCYVVYLKQHIGYEAENILSVKFKSKKLFHWHPQSWTYYWTNSRVI